MFGFINLNKPGGVTSRTAINTIKHLVKPAKVGHAGTLDPLATGVLVTAVGPATRLVRFVQDMPKRYVGTFRLGFHSDTEDIEGDVQQLDNAPEVSADQLQSALPAFTGPIDQVPPSFSALKVNGKRAYALARAGQSVALKSRTVQIYSLRLTRFDFPEFELEIECGGGTYVRSLGRDIARSLKTEAIMTALQRTAIGAFTLDSAVDPESINLETLQQQLLAPQTALPDVARVTIDDTTVAALENAVPWQASEENLADQLLAIDGRQRLIAMLERSSGNEFTPAINFAPYWKQQA